MAATDKYEIVFSFDTTGSMYCYLEEVRRELKKMVQDLNRDIPGIRIAIFAHGDYCDKNSSYVTKHFDFTNDANQLCNFVNNVGSTHGGDAPECYELVLREVQEKLSWSTQSQKSLVMIGDAPPHEPTEAQNYRHLDWREEARRLREMDIKIYAVECGSSNQVFYQQIASQTFGHRMALSDIKGVRELLMSICYREAGLEPPGGTKPTLASSISVGTEYIPVMEETVSTGTKPSVDEEQSGLICQVCKVGKLSNEFPPVTLTEDCDHATGICLRCVIKHVEDYGTCPHKGCGLHVDPDNLNLQWFQAILDEMFLDYSKVIAANRAQGGESGKDQISVATLNGDTEW